MIAIVTQMNASWRINHGKMGSAGYVPIGPRFSRAPKKYLLDHGKNLIIINGYETSH